MKYIRVRKIEAYENNTQHNDFEQNNTQQNDTAEQTLIIKTFNREALSRMTL
jgi:hypothetical protein